jgi:hypothetical protein
MVPTHRSIMSPGKRMRLSSSGTEAVALFGQKHVYLVLKFLTRITRYLKYPWVRLKLTFRIKHPAGTGSTWPSFLCPASLPQLHSWLQACQACARTISYPMSSSASSEFHITGICLQSCCKNPCTTTSYITNHGTERYCDLVHLGLGLFSHTVFLRRRGWN